MALTREKFYVIVPKAATNLITNPSFELGTTGWTASGAGVTIVKSFSTQRRGASSCAVITASGVDSGVQYSVSLTSGTQYTFSADVRDVNGQAFTMYIHDGTSAVASVSWTGMSKWKRHALTYTANASGTHTLVIQRDAVASILYFYVDGAQLEVGTESTYFDGDFGGLTTQKDYGWNGNWQASTSYRLASTRNGGTLLDIEDYAKILGHVGLGRAPETHYASEINADGEFWQDVKVMPRDFVINMVFSGSTAEMIQARKSLLSALSLDKTPVRQPLVLRYIGVDDSGEWMTEPVDIVCTYQGGLERAATTYGAEKCAVQFRSAKPYHNIDGHSGASLGYSTTVTNFANIGYRDTDGAWKAMGTGCNNTVRAMVKAPDGSIYIGGEFTSAGGVANTAYIAKWDGSAFSALGTGMNDYVNALAIGPDGALYAGGYFTLAGGVANTARIAKWTGSAWVALGTGIASGGVLALAFGRDGKLFIGGSFTNHGDANGDYVTSWNGTAYASLGTGTNDQVLALVYGGNGILYVGGIFTLAGGVANTSCIAKWDGSAFSALGAGISSAVRVLFIGNNGILWAGGSFVTAGGVAANRIAQWNGTSWAPLGSGVNSSVWALATGPNNELYIGGAFTTAGGITLPDRMAVYTVHAWRPVDINVNDTSANVYSMLPLDDGRLYIGGTWTGTSATSATSAVQNNTGVKGYPFLTLIGPGSCWQIKNYTNGDAIYLKNLTLLAGETAAIDCNPRNFRIWSNWRGNLQSYVLPGSTNLSLEPGSNNISAYMSGTTGSSAVKIQWQPTVSCLEEALR